MPHDRYWHDFYAPEMTGVATPEQRSAVHSAFLAAGLEPDGESLEHARIIDAILFSRGNSSTVALHPDRQTRPGVT